MTEGHDTAEPSDTHVVVNAVLLICVAVFGLLSCCSVGINLLDFFGVIDGFSQATYESEAERLGGLTAYLWVGVWALMVTVCGPVAAVGLLKRKTWARGLSMVVWCLNGLGCCCLAPLCVYGLWSLNTQDVKALFNTTQ